MDFTGHLSIAATEPLTRVVEQVGKALGINFRKDTSGVYEEFPAFVADVLGMEIAILGIPSQEDQDPDKPIGSYSLLVRTIVEAPDDSLESDISIHLCHILREAGISCSPDAAN